MTKSKELSKFSGNFKSGHDESFTLLFMYYLLLYVIAGVFFQ